MSSSASENIKSLQRSIDLGPELTPTLYGATVGDGREEIMGEPLRHPAGLEQV